MLNQRRQAADIVAADFLKAEQATDQAAALTAACVASMLQQRSRAGLPVDVGLDALKLVADAASELVSARRNLVEAHRALATVRDDIGLRRIRGYGDSSECPPLSAEAAAAEAPRLAIVA